MDILEETSFDEIEILKELNLCFKGIPGKYYPAVREQDIKYNFFLDLEHGYCETAGNYIHLYADAKRWAIVFEKSGYQNRGCSAEITLDYIGNCIDYPVNIYPERNYISNSSRIMLIEPKEFERIQNTEGEGLETFELIGKNIKEIQVRNTMVAFDNDPGNYEKAGIMVRDYNNPQNLIGFGGLVRYFHETNPHLIQATDNDIRKHISHDIPLLMTINEFHYKSTYDPANLPEQQEVYKLIAKILVTKDISLWQPTESANNSWKNWESGNL